MYPGDTDKEASSALLEKIRRPVIAELVQRANEGYLHWDKVKHLELPDDVTPNELWFAVSLSRSSQFQKLPLTTGWRELKYWVPPRHQAWLHRIDQDAGGLIGSRSRHISPEGDGNRFLFNSLMEEAIASSQLEGASTTRPVAKEMLRAKRKPKNRHEQMILNNYNAILEIRDLKDEPLTPQMLCRIQELITDKTLDNPAAAGRFKNASDPPVEVVDTVTDEVLHEPPSHNHTEHLIEELCDFANSKQKTFIHPVVKAITIHFMIAYIHPFVDGNGRTARAIFYWYMLKSGYWIFEFLPISRIVLDSVVSYGRAYLYTETDDFDLTYFLHYNLRIIDRAVREMHEYFATQQSSMRQAREAVDGINGLNHRQIAVAYDAIQNPHATFTIKQHAGLNQVTNATARSDLFGLEQRGILQKRLEGAKWVFSAPMHLKKRLQSGSFRRVPDKVRKVPAESLATTELENDNTEPSAPAKGQKTLFDGPLVMSEIVASPDINVSWTK